MPYTVDHNTDSKTISPALIGKKAYDLLQLNSLAIQLDSDIRVPRFCFTTSDLVTSYYHRRGRFPRIAYSPLANADEIPEVAKHYFNDLYDLNQNAFEDCIARLGPVKQIYIGSSLCAGSDRALSFAGINCRTDPYARTSDAFTLKRAIEHVVSGLYRPMAEWYLSCHGLASEMRSCGIMFYEFIDVHFEAVAHIVNDYVYVESKPVLGEAPGEIVAFTLDSAERWEGYWRINRRGERLQQALFSLSRIIAMDVKEMLEVEFCFNSEDLLYFLQYRTYRVDFEPEKTGTLTAPHIPIFSQVGKVSGRPISLLHQPKSKEVLAAIYEHAWRDNTQVVWLVNRHSAEWDSFSLLWAISRKLIKHDSRIAICHRQRKPFHFTTVMREDPNTAFFAEIDLTLNAQVERSCCVTIQSDGLKGRLSNADKKSLVRS